MNNRIFIMIGLTILGLLNLGLEEFDVRQLEMSPIDRPAPHLTLEQSLSLPMVNTPERTDNPDQELHGKHLSEAIFDAQAICLLTGWRWQAHGGQAWCETYVSCDAPIPVCPGGNDQWTDVTESSRICVSTRVQGYRVYCHQR